MSNTTQLTKKQQDFVNFFAKSTGGEMWISGEGGTGKTKTIIEALSTLKPWSHVVIIAPSHRALRVIGHNLDISGWSATSDEEYDCTRGCSISIGTVAKALGTMPDTGSLPTSTTGLDPDFIEGAGSEWWTAEVVARSAYAVIVDEASMLSKKQAQLIRGLTPDDCLIVWSGDDAQLGPIRGKKIFSRLRDKADKAIVLKKQFRQAKGLRALSRSVRRTGHLPENATSGNGVTYYDDYIQWVTALYDQANHQEIKSCVSVVYTNAEAEELCRACDPDNKQRYFWTGAECEAMTMIDTYRPKKGGLFNLAAPGDPVDLEHVTQETVKLPWINAKQRRYCATLFFLDGDLTERGIIPAHEWRGGCGALVAHKNYIHKVTAAAMDHRRTSKFLSTLQKKIVRPMDNHGLYAETRAGFFDRLATKYLDTMPTPIARRKIIRLIFGRYFYGYLAAEFLPLYNSTAGTCHRAQGSGFDSVFVNWTTMQGPDADQLRYVAVTRARDELHIFTGVMPD